MFFVGIHCDTVSECHGILVDAELKFSSVDLEVQLTPDKCNGLELSYKCTVINRSILNFVSFK